MTEVMRQSSANMKSRGASNSNRRRLRFNERQEVHGAAYAAHYHPCLPHRQICSRRLRRSGETTTNPSSAASFSHHPLIAQSSYANVPTAQVDQFGSSPARLPSFQCLSRRRAGDRCRRVGSDGPANPGLPDRRNARCGSIRPPAPAGGGPVVALYDRVGTTSRSMTALGGQCTTLSGEMPRASSANCAYFGSVGSNTSRRQSRYSVGDSATAHSLESPSRIPCPKWP